MFVPEKFQQVWGDQLKAGLAKRDPSLGALHISAGGMLAIGDDFVGDGADSDPRLPPARTTALYVGGMGARGKNFYNTIAQTYGYEDEAIDIQDLYLDGKKDEAAAAVPRELLELQPRRPGGYVKERSPPTRRPASPTLGHPVGRRRGQDRRDAAHPPRLSREDARSAASTLATRRARVSPPWRR